MPLPVIVDIVPRPPGRSNSLLLELEPGDTAQDIVKELLSLEPKKGAWQLLETWHNCKKVISSVQDVYELRKAWGNEAVRFQLRQRPISMCGTRKARGMHSSTKRVKMKAALLSHPKSFLKRKCTHKRLYCAKWVMEQALRQSRMKYSRMLLNRIVKGESLWGPSESSPLDSLQAELISQKADNLHLSSEIADLNITSTRLRNQTHALRQKEQELQKKLTQLQVEVTMKREEKERRGPRDLTQVQTDIIKLKRELESRNRLNASHTTKLKNKKELLAEKRKILEERQKELETIQNSPITPVTVISQMMCSRDKKTASQDVVKEIDEPDLLTGGQEFSSENALQSPIHVKRESNVSMSSTSKKRHTSKFEAKTKQLIEEEGMSFRRILSQHKDRDKTATVITGQVKLDPDLKDQEHFQPTDLDTYRKSAVHLHSEGPDVLVIPKEDVKWYESQNSQEVSSFEENSNWMSPSPNTEFSIKQKAHSVNVQSPNNLKSFPQNETLASHVEVGEQKTDTKGTKNVKFEKESLILNAALDGDLELLRECIRELGSCSYVSDKGATCLHNAVCSRNMEMVELLVEMGCDINAQDIDGWTPLHCAAAYRNVDMIRYLVENGSSLFLATQDGDTPLKISIEEYEVERQSQGESDKKEEKSKRAVECLHYLMDIQTNLGVSNHGQVFVMFSRLSSEPDELSISKGESLVITDRGERGDQWWMAKNMDGQTGLVPCTFLGPYYRHSISL